MLLLESQIFTRLHQHVKRHNQAQTELRHTIRLGSLLTLQAVTNEYIKRVRQAMKLPEFADDDRLPSYFASRRRLADLTKCCHRTIYNHLDLLTAVGLVVKRWHGRQCDFELWLNPWLLFPEVNEPPLVVDLNTNCLLPFAIGRRQILPPKSTVETEESHNYPKSGVETVDNRQPVRLNELIPPFPRLASNTADTADTAERRCAAPKTEDTGEKGRGGGPAALGVDNSGNNPQNGISREQRLQRNDKAVQRATGTTEIIRPSQPVAVPLSLGEQPEMTPPIPKEYYKSLVIAFWDTVLPEFWPDNLISEKHTGEILNLLWQDLFGSFSDQPSEKIATERYMVRLQQAQKALAHARRHRWTGFLPPKLYFSLAYFQQQQQSNQKGSFWYTWQWMQEDEVKRQQVDKERLLQRAIYSFVHEKAPKGLKDGRGMSRLQLANYWRNRIHKVADADLLSRFDTAVLSPMPGRQTSTEFPIEKPKRKTPKPVS